MNLPVTTLAHLPAHPMTKKEMAAKMGISESTLRRRLKHAGLSVERGLIPPGKQVEVLDALGWREMTRNDALQNQITAELCPVMPTREQDWTWNRRTSTKK